MKTPALGLEELRRQLDKLQDTFLAPSQLTTRELDSFTSADRLQLGAFIVLSHAAFETFFEDLATWRLERIVASWTTNGLHPGLLSLLLHCGKPQRLTDKDKEDPDEASETVDQPKKTQFNRVRKALAEAKKVLSRTITDANHGISTRHLRKVYLPLGVDVPTDFRWIAALDEFATIRGTVAHVTIRGRKQLRPPDQVVNIVKECLWCAGQLTERVEKESS